jgi:ADP-ribosylglycohydrolase
MLGAIAGDIIGSPYEYLRFKEMNFPLFSERSNFTDDTVLTVAVADAVLHNRDFALTLKEYGRRYPNAGYGGSFYKWMQSDTLKPYKSWGNGCAMRTSPIGFLLNDASEILKIARQCSAVTHNHVEGIRGSQAVSYAIYLARQGRSKDDIRLYTRKWFGYNLNRSLEEIRPGYHFDVSCMGTVPPAIIAFLDSQDYESAVRNAISLGGDADTLACIAGALAEAFYKEIPAEIQNETRQRLPQEFLDIIDECYEVMEKPASD